MRPDNCRYLETHEWVRQDGDLYTTGITDFAVEELSDIVFLNLPKVGTELERDQPFGEIESVKAVFDLHAPVAGEVVEVNEELPDNLDTLAEGPYEGGWMIKVRATGDAPLDGLMTAAEYDAFISNS